MTEAAAPKQEQAPLVQPGQPTETPPSEKTGYAEVASTVNAYLHAVVAKQWNEADAY